MTLFFAPALFFFFAKPSPLGIRPTKSGRSFHKTAHFANRRTQTVRFSAKGRYKRTNGLSKMPDASPETVHATRNPDALLAGEKVPSAR